MKVFKYVIDPCDPEIYMPPEAEILKAEFQNDHFCLWALVDENSGVEARHFCAFATGQKIPESMGLDYGYIGTSTNSQGLVFHAFERFGF